MQLVTDYLEITCQKYPDKKAFIDEKTEMTFSQLNTASKKLGTVIASTGSFQKPVCIFMDKSVECIAAMLGIIASGNFYTVLDVNMPEARMHKILTILQPAAVVTTAAYRERFAEIIAECGMDQNLKDTIIYEDAMKEKENPELLAEVRAKIDEKATMFVLFTSGSTGVPKGVIIKHKAFPPYLKWYKETLGYDETTVIANQTPFYYIMSCPDIYLTILCGGTCYIPPKKVFSFPMVTLNYLKEHEINTIEWVPSVLCLIANFNALPELHLDKLRLVVFGGEVMPAKQLNMWRKEYPDVKFYNLYGLTETTEMMTYYEITRDMSDKESLPIGLPVFYLKTMILDDEDREVPDGEMGELCVSGIAVAEGYYNMPEKTAEVFVANPLYREGDDPETKIMYRTGDIVKKDEDGNIIYMCRKDFQIKHMGNRIELGEIETAASSVDGVDRNCCLYDTKRSRIVIFYTGNIDEDTLDEKLRTIVPDYMVPNRYEKIDEMPINVNGKIDRVALKELI